MSDGGCLSDFSQLPGVGGGGERPGVSKTWNQPHLPLGKFTVDLCTGKYEQKGIVENKEAQKVIARRVQPICDPFYGDIPPGVTIFSDKGFPGDVLFYNGEEFEVRNKNELVLKKEYARLPDGWEKVVDVG